MERFSGKPLPVDRRERGSRQSRAARAA